MSVSSLSRIQLNLALLCVAFVLAERIFDWKEWRSMLELHICGRVLTTGEHSLSIREKNTLSDNCLWLVELEDEFVSTVVLGLGGLMFFYVLLFGRSSAPAAPVVQTGFDKAKPPPRKAAGARARPPAAGQAPVGQSPVGVLFPPPGGPGAFTTPPTRASFPGGGGAGVSPPPPGGAAFPSSPETLEQALESSVNRTIFFEICLERTSHDQEWGIAIDRGDAKAWTISSVKDGTPAALGRAAACIGDENPNNRLRLQKGDLLLAINHVTAVEKFDEALGACPYVVDPNTQIQTAQRMRLGIVRTMWKPEKVQTMIQLLQKEEGKNPTLHTVEGQTKSVSLASFMPKENEVERVLEVSQLDPAEVGAHLVDTPKGKLLRLGATMKKAKTYGPGGETKESLYVVAMQQGSLLATKAGLRTGDYIDAIEFPPSATGGPAPPAQSNLAASLGELQKGRLQNGLKLRIRRVEPKVNYAPDSVIQGGIDVMPSVATPSPDQSLLPLCFDQEGACLGNVHHLSVAVGDRLVHVSHKTGFLQMAIEFCQDPGQAKRTIPCGLVERTVADSLTSTPFSASPADPSPYAADNSSGGGGGAGAAPGPIPQNLDPNSLVLQPTPLYNRLTAVYNQDQGVKKQIMQMEEKTTENAEAMIQILEGLTLQLMNLQEFIIEKSEQLEDEEAALAEANLAGTGAIAESLDVLSSSIGLQQTPTAGGTSVPKGTTIDEAGDFGFEDDAQLIVSAPNDTSGAVIGESKASSGSQVGGESAAIVGVSKASSAMLGVSKASGVSSSSSASSSSVVGSSQNSGSVIGASSVSGSVIGASNVSGSVIGASVTGTSKAAGAVVAASGATVGAAEFFAQGQSKFLGVASQASSAFGGAANNNPNLAADTAPASTTLATPGIGSTAMMSDAGSMVSGSVMSGVGGGGPTVAPDVFVTKTESILLEEQKTLGTSNANQQSALPGETTNPFSATTANPQQQHAGLGQQTTTSNPFATTTNQQPALPGQTAASSNPFAPSSANQQPPLPGQTNQQPPLPGQAANQQPPLPGQINQQPPAPGQTAANQQPPLPGQTANQQPPLPGQTTNQQPPLPGQTANQQPPLPGQTANQQPPLPGKTGNQQPPLPGQTANQQPPLPGQTANQQPPLPGQTANQQPPLPGQTANQQPPLPGQTANQQPPLPGQTANQQPPLPGQTANQQPPLPGQTQSTNQQPPLPATQATKESLKSDNIDEEEEEEEEEYSGSEYTEESGMLAEFQYRRDSAPAKLIKIRKRQGTNSISTNMTVESSFELDRSPLPAPRQSEIDYMKQKMEGKGKGKKGKGTPANPYAKQKAGSPANPYAKQKAASPGKGGGAGGPADRHSMPSPTAAGLGPVSPSGSPRGPPAHASNPFASGTAGGPTVNAALPKPANPFMPQSGAPTQEFLSSARTPPTTPRRHASGTNPALPPLQPGLDPMNPTNRPSYPNSAMMPPSASNITPPSSARVPTPVGTPRGSAGGQKQPLVPGSPRGSGQGLQPLVGGTAANPYMMPASAATSNGFPQQPFGNNQQQGAPAMVPPVNMQAVMQQNQQPPLPPGGGAPPAMVSPYANGVTQQTPANPYNNPTLDYNRLAKAQQMQGRMPPAGAPARPMATGMPSAATNPFG